MNMNDYLFGPVNVKFCAYFYFLSIIQFTVMVVLSVFIVYNLLSGKKIDAKTTMTAVMGALAYGVLYFQSRLLHSMCIHGEHNNS
jgi:hypothetical protein